MVRRCAGCQRDLEDTEFYKNKDGGFCNGMCKECEKERARLRYAKNPERGKLRQRIYYKNHREKCLDYIRKYGKIYYLENKDEILAKNRARWADNKDTINAKQRHKYATDPEYKKYVKEKEQKRYEKFKMLIDKLKGNTCTDCKGMFNRYQLEFDHVRGEKKFILSGASRKPVSQILEEAAKCDVVCSNCHHMRTFKHLISQQKGGDNAGKQDRISQATA